MDIKSYLHILMTRLWITILIPFLAAAATAGINLYVLEPIYESSTTLYVMNKDFDRLAYDDFLVSQQLLKDCREIIRSKSIAKTVIGRLNLENLTEEELAKKIAVNLKNDTRLLEIKVSDTSSARAKTIADEISVAFRQRVSELIKLETLEVVDEAEEAGEPSSPKPLMNTVIAFFAAQFLVICGMFIKSSG